VLILSEIKVISFDTDSLCSKNASIEVVKLIGLLGCLYHPLVVDKMTVRVLSHATVFGIVLV
jgi:hypothetical protein